MKIALVVSVRIPESFTKEIISELVLKKISEEFTKTEEEIGIPGNDKSMCKRREGRKKHGILETSKDVSTYFLNASNSETIHQCKRYNNIFGVFF